jgi:hypothetical protein
LNGYEIFEKSNHTYSRIGAELLYTTLRRFQFTSQHLEELEQNVTFFQENPAVREKCGYAFASLGKQAIILFCLICKKESKKK